MNQFLKFISLLLFTCLINQSLSQVTYNMQDTLVTDCEGIHKDSDAQFGGRYGKNEDFTFTICPGSGAQIIYTFTFLSLEPDFDSIMFFDGPTTGSPFIVGYTGNYAGTPPPVIATSGCLTIRFISDATLDFNGWDAFWTTIPPVPQQPVMDTSAIDPPACDSSNFTIVFDIPVHCDSLVASSFTLTGTNAPSIIAINPLGGCLNDSTQSAEVVLSAPLQYNCEYMLDFDLNVPDVCDSVYSFTISDTFSFSTCDILYTITPEDTVCIGQCTNISVNVFPGCNTYTYSWSAGLPNTPGPHNVCPVNDSTYYVTVTEVETGVTFTDSVRVIVLDTINPNIDIQLSTFSPPYCDSLGFNVVFSPAILCNYIDSGVFVLSNGASLPPSVLSFTQLNCTSGMVDSVRVNLSSPLISNCEYHLDYVLNVTDACNTINLTVSDTFSLTTCPLDSTLTYPDTICIGNCGNVQVNQNGCSTYSYSWSNGLPATAGPHSICPTGDTTFWVTIIEDSTLLQRTDTVKIQAFPQGIVLDMNINASAPNCAADSIILDFTPSVNCGAIQLSQFNLVGGIQVPTITSVVPVNCIGNTTNSVIVYLSNNFQYNCDYEIYFDIDTVDACGILHNITLADTFRVQDCEINYTLNYPDTICGGTCANVTITPVSTCFGLHYNWSNGLPDSPGPHIICPSSDTMFTVIITEDTTGVLAYDTIRIFVDTSLLQYSMSLDSVKGVPECDSVTIHVKFSAPVPCDSIYAAAFNLTGGTTPPTVVNAIPTGCSGPGDSTTTATIVISNPYPGNCVYTLNFLIRSSFCSSIMSTAYNIYSCDLTATFTYDDTVCYGYCTQLTTTTNSCFPVAYTWSNGLPGFGGPHNICPNGDTVFYVTLNETFTGKSFTDTIDIKFINTRITSAPNMCIYDPPTTLTAATPGGVWAGNGITNTLTGAFDPSFAGSGTHKITYDLLGCRDSIYITITNVEAGPFDTLCTSGIPHTLTGYSPAGGTWSGVNVSPGGVFTPILYGPHTLYYTVNGCVDSTEIFVDTIAKTYSFDTVCRYDAPFNIPITPSGGTWTGTGITNTNLGTFDPSIAFSGNNTVYYNFIGCMDSVSIYVVDVAAGPDTLACPLQAPFNLAPASPAGGVWSGVGIINPSTGLYDPSLVGNGNTDTVRYTFYGCDDTLLVRIIQTDIAVDTLPFCLDEIPIQLIGSASNPIIPAGGTWTGNGVVYTAPDYFFHPNLAGIGAHTLIYDANSCSDSIVMVVYPDSLSYNDSTICDTHLPFLLDSINNVIGATWVGPGVVNPVTGLFDPAIANVGPNVIYYTNPAFNCEDSITITVYPFVPSQITFPDSLCYFSYDSLITAVPAGGTWGGTGIYNQTLGTFNPVTAGPLSTHEIIYKFGVGQCLTADTHYVYVRDSLSLSLTASLTKLCPGQSTTLTAVGSGGYPSPTYNYTWSHTTNTNPIQTITPAATGNYTVTLDDGCSDPKQATIQIEVYPSPVSTLTVSPTLCYGELGYVTYDITQPGHTYTWLQPITVGDTAFALTEDTVKVRITNSFGCSMDTAIEIPSYGNIVADFDVEPNLPPGICLPYNDPSLKLIDQSVGGVTGTWDLGEANFSYSPGSDVNYTYVSPGSYTIELIIKNAGPCYDTATAEVCVLSEPIFVPDVFSPNRDGSNDILFARGQQIDKLEFYVFDRWGKLLFQSRDLNTGWDGTFEGKEANAGVYVYYVKALLTSGDVFELKGDVTLVR